MVDDPFASPEEAAVVRPDIRSQLITGGRYRLANRDGSHKKGGWQRVTKMVSAYSDGFGLRIWETEQVMLALAINETRVIADLRRTLARCATVEKAQKREEIEQFLNRCKELSGGDEGAKFGNSRHTMVEADHLALPMGAPDAYARRHLYLYRAALVRNKLVAVQGMQERRVLVEELEAVGTLDNILTDELTGIDHIGDLKTQKRFWTWLEIAAQFACYAHAVAMWVPTDPKDARAGHWTDMPKVDQSMAFALWMPRAPVDPAEPWEPHADVYEVDIVAGWKTAQLAREIVQDRAGGKRKRDPRAWLRAAPAVTETEIYAARFAAVDSIEEGRALVAEAKKKGVWSEILADEARIALERLKKVPVGA